jgi:hypothetical protein
MPEVCQLLADQQPVGGVIVHYHDPQSPVMPCHRAQCHECD